MGMALRRCDVGIYSFGRLWYIYRCLSMTSSFWSRISLNVYDFQLTLLHPHLDPSFKRYRLIIPLTSPFF
jgi:hypothetical protein